MLRWLVVLLALGDTVGEEDATITYERDDGIEVLVPRMLYGTAWKEERTTRLVTEALEMGFLGVDTANQPKHYNEEAVGEALKLVIPKRPRETIFVQSKFTPASGQDPERIPYDPNATIMEQVLTSFQGSLEHLGVSYLDAFLLHSPYGSHEDTLSAWRAMESVYRRGGARLVGVSNFDRHQLEALLKDAHVKPALVQNRDRASEEWDKSVREFCVQYGVMHQGFSVLTANRHVVSDPFTRDVARSVKRTPEQVVLKFALHLGTLLLAGPSDTDHMRDDLDLFTSSVAGSENAWSLSPGQIDRLHEISTASKFNDQTRISCTFRNELEYPLNAFWEDNGGKQVEQGSVGPGEEWKLETYHSHEFVFKNPEHEVVKRWRADAAVGLEQLVAVNTKMTARIKNHRADMVTWSWREPVTGELHPQGEVPAHGYSDLTLQTFDGHEFVAQAHDGSIVFEWLADADHGSDQEVEINEREEL